MASVSVAETTSATVEGLLRLAWLAEVEGRPRLRDAVMTLAVAESGPGDAVLAERCRRKLVARQPDHWFGTSATLGQALTHQKVASALSKLRTMFPPVRVQWMLTRGAVQRGPFTGRPLPFARVLSDLGLTPERAANRDRRRALPFAPLEPPALYGGVVDAASLAPFYLAVLVSIAVLVQVVREEKAGARDGDTKAA